VKQRPFPAPLYFSTELRYVRVLPSKAIRMGQDQLQQQLEKVQLILHNNIYQVVQVIQCSLTVFDL